MLMLINSKSTSLIALIYLVYIVVHAVRLNILLLFNTMKGHIKIVNKYKKQKVFMSTSFKMDGAINDIAMRACSFASATCLVRS